MNDKRITITTGKVRIPVSVDGDNGKYIAFDPDDIEFIKRLHTFYNVALEEAKKWKARAVELEASVSSLPVDENQMPTNIEALTQPFEEMNQFMASEIDKLLGVGTCANIFGENFVTRDIGVYVQLIEGIQEVLAPARVQVIEKYVAKKPRKRRK